MRALRLAAPLAALCLAVPALLRAPGAAAPVPLPTHPPAAPVRPVTENFYGTRVTDRYRYLEKLSDPAVQRYFREQNAYTRAILARFAAPHAKLLARISALDNASASVSDVTRVGDQYFYERLDPGRNVATLDVRGVADGSPQRVLVDPQSLVTGPGKHFTIEEFTPSFDGKYVAYGIVEGGSENQAVLHVMDVATGRVLPDTITRTDGVGATAWLPDDSGFYYFRYPKLAPNAPQTEAEEKGVAYLHVLGRDPDQDVPVFGYGVASSIAFDPTDFPVVELTPGSRWAIGIVQRGVKNEIEVYAAPAESVTGPATPWKKVADFADDVTAVDWRADTLYLLTHKDAPNYKVIATSLDRPDLANPTTVVAPSRDVVEQLGVTGDGLYVRSRTGGFGQIHKIPLAGDGTVAGAPVALTLPYRGSIDAMTTDPRVSGVTFGLTAWTESLLYYRSDGGAGVAKTDLKPKSPVDESMYTSAEVNATSADGTQVPLSLIYPKGIRLDGSHPTYLEGYGAYGFTIEPYFSTVRVAWLEHSGVYAVCHVRGSGWYGEDWHRAGMLATKIHTVEDFVGCARWLVDHHYTSPARLAGEGTSAGGITIGGAITRAPRLFAAALDVVGVVDALRSEFSSNGPPNIPEFGSVTTKSGFDALYPVDAYQHVRDGVAYPAVMAITGINDPRVPPWEAAKFAARLQAATSSGRPVLLRVDYDAGHGMLAGSRAQNDALLADEWTFLFWQLGVPGFQQLPERIGARPPR